MWKQVLISDFAFLRNQIAHGKFIINENLEIIVYLNSDKSKFNGFMVLNEKTGYSAAHDKTKIAYINVEDLMKDYNATKALEETLKAKQEEIFLLPGVELSVNDGANGVHTIITFSDQWLENGNDYISPFITSS